MSLWYLQEGATLAAVDGSSSISSVATLRETVVLHSSPYSTAYELNGLSTSGDWYQVVVADNWPGCNSGFEEAIEVWNNVDVSGPITCDSNVTLSGGDQIQFQLSFNSLHQGCLELDDLTTSATHSVCQSQPDSGATGFELIGTPANAYGYYSGMMTETINQTAPGCPHLTRLPTMSYSYPSLPYFTGYTPWSDEFDLASGTTCYQQSNGTVTLSATDPTSHYAETAGGTAYGPHWVQGQNLSYVVPGVGLVAQTDPRPITSVNLTAAATVVAIGRSTNLTTGGAGGNPPYSALWKENGSLLGIGGLVRQFNATRSGNFTFESYLVDRQNDVLGPSNSVVVQVPWGLWVSGPTASPHSGGADIGQRVVFSVVAHGGVDPKTYTWGGLPLGCPTVFGVSIVCTPNATGPDTISVLVHDSNGTTASSPTLRFVVSSAPSVRLTESALDLDLNQTVNYTATPSGGSGGWTFRWAGLPPGCASTAASFVCRPTSAGAFTVTVTAIDSNGGNATTTNVDLSVFVAPSVRLTVSSAIADVGQSIAWVAEITGGTAGGTVHWQGWPSGCLAPTNLTPTCGVAVPGTISVSVSIVDGVGVAASSPTVMVTVFPAPSSSITVSPASPSAGADVVLTAHVTGGSGGLRFAWAGLPSGCANVTSSTVTCSAVGQGVYEVRVSVTDAAGLRTTANATLNVPGTPVALGGPAGTLTPVEWLLVLVVVAVVVGGAVAVLRRRKPEPPTDLDAD